MERNDLGKRHDAVNVLRVDASARREGSVSRQLGDELVAALEHSSPRPLRVTRRDLAATSLPFVDAAWIAAKQASSIGGAELDSRTLRDSDELIEELKSADILVIGLPIYNFGVPAALKAWVDMVARARVTFRYTSDGPVGLLTGKQAYLVVASDGTAVGSAIDFATGYMRHILGFMGITDVELIAADELMRGREQSIGRARARIAGLAARRTATVEPRLARVV
jgi:FMN-dependent NADH-azoreductase